MTQNHKSKLWHIMHSLWMFALFFPLGLFAPFSFIYIGFRVKHQKWIREGFILILPVYVSFFMIVAYEDENIITDIGVAINLMVWFYTIVRGVASRHRYIRMLLQQDENYTIVQRKEKTYVPKAKPIEKRNRRKPTLKATNEIKKININKANEAEIAQLPSIPPLLAKKVLTIREKEGEFTSIEHLAKTTNIKPHILMRSKAYIVFDDESLKEEKEDLAQAAKKKQKNKGRIVDY